MCVCFNSITQYDRLTPRWPPLSRLTFGGLLRSLLLCWAFSTCALFFISRPVSDAAHLSFSFSLSHFLTTGVLCNSRSSTSGTRWERGKRKQAPQRANKWLSWSGIVNIVKQRKKQRPLAPENGALKFSASAKSIVAQFITGSQSIYLIWYISRFFLLLSERCSTLFFSVFFCAVALSACLLGNLCTSLHFK